MAAFEGDASAQRALAAARGREAIGSFPHGIKHMTSERFGVSAVVRGDTILSIGRRKTRAALARTPSRVMVMLT